MKEKLKHMLSELSVKDIAILILSVVVIILILWCSIATHKYHDALHNIVIWNDSATIYKNKYNEEYQAKNTYILKANELEEYSKELYNEYKSLKDHPVVITKTEIITLIDSIYTNVDSLLMNNDTIKWEWSANDKDYYHINGNSYIIQNSISPIVNTRINNLLINSKLSLDVIDNGKQLQVIAKTDNPYITLDNMQSVVIDPSTSPTIKSYNKPKRWGIGPYLGFGINAGADFKGLPLFTWGLSVGIAVHYDIFQW